MILTPCKFRLENSPYFEGMRLGMPSWHGFGNVGVTPEEHQKIMGWARGMRLTGAARRLAETRPCGNGLIYLLSPPWLVTVFEPEEVA